MSKLWNEIGDTAYYQEERRLPVPDYTTEKLSCWTYTDMKREFAKSMEFFSENGFFEERISLAYQCVCLALCFPDKGKTDAAAMTENVMANTIRVLEAFKEGNDKSYAPSRREYEEQISAYRSAEAHGLTLSVEEQAGLDCDIKAALEMIQSCEYPKPKSDEDDFSRSCKPINMHFKSVILSPPPADSDKRLRERLSDRAYEMLTEYEREKEIIDIDFLENEYLKPNGLELTDELREFAELYAGREYVWHAPMFFMDYPLSLSWYKGYSVDLYLTWTGTIIDGNYYIPAMSEFVPPYTGPEVGGDGKIHYYSEEYWKNYPELSPISPEEFFEREARERFKDQLLLKRRRELENKYLIPEIRTASM